MFVVVLAVALAAPKPLPAQAKLPSPEEVFEFRVQHRSQTHGTFKLFLNALFLWTED